MMTPEQIAEYIHEEHTPYASMSIEERKKHLAELIQEYADCCYAPLVLNGPDLIISIDSRKANESTRANTLS
jgi:hypothetical protein